MKTECPNCQSADWQPQYLTRAGLIETCPNCHIGKRSDFKPGEVLISTHTPSDVVDGVKRYHLDQTAREFNAAAFLDKIPPTPEGLYADIGCHIGFLLNEIQKRGKPTIGVDSNPNVLPYTNGKNVVIQDARAWLAQQESDRYAAVIYQNVLGHLDDPRSIIEQTYRILQPGGVCAIQAPNLDNPWTKLPKPFGQSWRYFVGSYNWYFDQDNITSLLQNSGFTEIKVTPSNRRITIGFAAQRMSDMLNTDILERWLPRHLSHSIWDRVRTTIDQLQATKLGQQTIETNLFHDSMDVISKKGPTTI